ncbi:hypothetical protein ANANG_G00299740, partial [Anguilla anguilla]
MSNRRSASLLLIQSSAKTPVVENLGQRESSCYRDWGERPGSGESSTELEALRQRGDEKSLEPGYRGHLQLIQPSASSVDNSVGRLLSGRGAGCGISLAVVLMRSHPWVRQTPGTPGCPEWPRCPGGPAWPRSPWRPGCPSKALPGLPRL